MSEARIQEEVACESGVGLENPTAHSTISSHEEVTSDAQGDSANGAKVSMMDLPNDTYTMLFLCKLGGQAFFYSTYIFALKLALLALLYMETHGDGRNLSAVDTSVLVAQFLLLPVAVAIQDDLISAYYIFANVRYSVDITRQNPYAYKWKFRAANICRCVDGLFSLAVNFMVLTSATEVLSLFLNFAALQFLQTIDNMALTLCAEGYFSDTLETVANHVIQAKLPKKQLRGKDTRYLDTGLFLVTLVVLVILWSLLSFVV